jgi:hypothetical protein
MPASRSACRQCRPLRFAATTIRLVDLCDRGRPGKITIDYHDAPIGVLATSTAKRAPGYISLGFPDPRRLIN